MSEKKDLKDSLITEEVRKIYTEIHQLRNQQFLITLAAVTFFGVSIGLIFQLNSSCANLTDGNMHPLSQSGIGVIIGLHLVLIGLLFWLCGLSQIIAGLSTYLVRQNWSQWEAYYPLYDQVKQRKIHLSQRKLITVIFMILGLLGTSIGYWIEANRSPSLFYYFLELSFYLALIWKIGFRMPESNRNDANDRWDIVFKKQNESFKSSEFNKSNH